MVYKLLKTIISIFAKAKRILLTFTKLEVNNNIFLVNIRIIIHFILFY